MHSTECGKKKKQSDKYFLKQPNERARQRYKSAYKNVLIFIYMKYIHTHTEKKQIDRHSNVCMCVMTKSTQFVKNMVQYEFKKKSNSNDKNMNAYTCLDEIVVRSVGSFIHSYNRFTRNAVKQSDDNGMYMYMSRMFWSFPRRSRLIIIVTQFQTTQLSHLNA